VNTNNGEKWRRFIVPKKVEQINDHLFMDTYKSNNINIGVNDMTVNDCEMCVRKVKVSEMHTPFSLYSLVCIHLRLSQDLVRCFISYSFHYHSPSFYSRQCLFNLTRKVSMNTLSLICLTF